MCNMQIIRQHPEAQHFILPELDIDFVFSCEAESLIFQLGLR